MTLTDSTPGGDIGVEELGALRARLDAIDQSLLEVLHQRIRCCLDIAAVKRRHGIPMMQPQRVGFVHSRAARYAADNGIDADFMRLFYDLVIGETCRLESLLIDGSVPQP